MSERTKSYLLLAILLLALVGVFAVVLWAEPAATAPAPHDDAPTLQKRLNRNDVVVTLAADYHTSTPVILTNVHGLTVFAYGASITADAGQTIATSQGDTLVLTNCSNVKIFGLAFDGNRKARGGFAGNPQTVRLNACTDVTFRDCSFTGDVCDGIFAWSGWVNPPTSDLATQRLTIDNCRFADSGRNCISLVHAAWVNVVNCDFTGPGGDPGVAVDVEANNGDLAGIDHHITIANNRARGLKSAFFVIGTASPCGVVVANNQIDRVSGDAILNFGFNTVVSGNNVSNCQRAGISSPKPGSVVLAGNNATVYQEN